MSTTEVEAFSKHTALVTGGRRGIGFAFARELARRGARVAITTRDASNVEGRLAELAACSPANAAPPIAVPWNMEDDPETAASAAMTALEALGISVGLFVHAAHVFAPHRLVLATKPEMLARSLEQNVVAPFALARRICRSMGRARFGRVLFVGSLVASIGGEGQSAYIIEKSALEGMARAFASEFGTRGVTVNVIAPGIVDTENVRERVRPEIAEAFAARTHEGRLATPEEIALAGMPFLDPRQGSITGQVLRVAGGADGLSAERERTEE
jgi:3-oxoacyl-[acyl-carrier protein] reductase